IADGDHIYGVIKGSGLNHGGKTNGYTVPNPKAQGEVISQALEESGVHPRVISYVEAHGTGTALGDPIEIAGLTQAFGAQTKERQYCAIGSAKSNVGHCESAAGIAGLTKVLLQMQHGRLVKSLHSEKLNPHIDFSCTPFVVQREFGEWLRPVLLLDGHQREYLRTAGISSFGAGGSNAHLIVEEYVAPAREVTAIRGPVAVVLSARSEERLQVHVQQLLAYLDEHEVNLVDLAYTLQVGREALGMRLAVVVNSVEALKGKLAQVSQNKISGLEDLYWGEVKRTQETLAVFRADEELQEAISKWVARGKVGKLAELWVQGLVVDWAALYGESKPQRLSLPAYPFAPERYWVPESASIRGASSIQWAQLHPLVHRNSSNLGEQRYSTTLSGEEFFVRDHVVGGKRLVPGVAQLEWARAAASLALDGESAIGLEQVQWLRSLVIESALEVHIGLREEPEGRIGYEIYSGQGEEAVVYSQGYAVVQPESETPQIDLTALVEQCTRKLSGAQSYEQFASLGIEYGSSFQVLKEVGYGAGVAVGALELSSESNQEGYSWSPSLLDGALQTSIGLLMGEPQQERGL
ncbi:MAG TPA: type I polyketide synthase, partial [Ktedonobacteraceae bacterium]|nr:type I polyketide synthase [Ktedonobacteraceae bacterium]